MKKTKKTKKKQTRKHKKERKWKNLDLGNLLFQTFTR